MFKRIFSDLSYEPLVTCMYKMLGKSEPTNVFPNGDLLVGGFNPFEKYESKWESSPNRGEN